MASHSNTVLWAEKCGALLQYPATLVVRFVENRHGLQLNGSRKKKKKVKKKRGPLNMGEKCQMEYHLQVRERLLRCYTRLLEAANILGYFPIHQPHSLLVTESDIDLDLMCSVDSSTDDLEPLETSSGSHGPTHVVGRVVSNESDQDRTINVMGRTFFVPPKSSFLLSDLSNIKPLYDHASTAGRYGLIVIDPPWENRSTIRSKRYKWLPSERLLELSIPRLAAVGAIVAVWVTNKRKIATFVQQTLFPKWHVDYLSEWHWLKVTTDGVLVHDMDSVHKKPYEMVIIGKYVGQEPSTQSSAVVLHCTPPKDEDNDDFDTPCSKRLKTGEPSTGHTISATSEDASYPLLPHPYTLLCVASATHSQKPYLGDILAKHLSEGSRRLELFARNLHPNWTSWGNEVLKFQQLKDLPLSHENTVTNEYPPKCQSSC